MRRLSLGLFLFLLSFSLAAQNIRDSVTIEVVDVPVFVTRDAKPVEGLTRDDFELYVNGKPQKIDYFDVVQTGQAAAPESLRERRLFLLMIDIAFSNPHSIGKAQRAAAEMIKRAPSSDLFAIATFSSRRGVWFATPFTSDRVALGRGIASLSASQSGDPLAIVMTTAERGALNDWALGNADRGDYFFHHDPVIDAIAGEIIRDLHLQPVRRAVEHQLLDFKDLAARLATLQGQKHVVLMSEGYASQPTAQFISSRPSTNRIPQGGVSLLTGQTWRFLHDMHEAFQGADVLLHTLDVRGVAPMRHNDSLYTLAEGTGGEFIWGRNDLGNQLVRLADRHSSGYVLGFTPAAAKRGHNTIEVKVKDRDMTVRHRKGFNGTPSALDVDEGLYLADVVLNDVPQSGTAADLAFRDGVLQVTVPLRPLAAQLGKSGTAELLVYVFGASGVALDFERRTIDVAANAEGEQTFAIDVPAGATVAKALLRVDESLGFSRTQL